MPYFIPFLMSLLACFVAQSLALQAVGGQTIKSESNFFSSIARIQTGVKNAPEIMILGSSITGRLPDRSHGFTGVANLGCDGGSALDTLRAIDRGDLPSAPHLIIEGNTLSRSLAAEETEISRAIRSPMFKIGMKIPQLGATARPSAFAYSLLFKWKIGSSGGPEGHCLPTESLPAIISSAPSKLASDERKLADEITAIISRLRKRGTESWIVMLPKSPNRDSPSYRIAHSVSTKAKIPFWNLEKGLTPEDYKLTDGVHMAPDSAAATVRTLLSAPEIQR